MKWARDVKSKAKETDWKELVREGCTWKNLFKYFKVFLTGTGIFIDA